MSVEEEELMEDASGFDNVLESISSQQKAPAGSTNKRARKRNKRKKALTMPDYIRGSEEMRKYWAQRYRIFSRFDEGIMLDRGNSY